MSKHTPGPWAEYGSAILGPEPQDVDFNRLRGFDDDNGGLGYLIAESIPHAPTRRLIAAAPDLLEVAKEWLETFDGFSVDEMRKRWDEKTVQRMLRTRAAIAKAEGKDHASR